jgi:putative PIG3 family NAD(P)H quinone oxidoreductase
MRALVIREPGPEGTLVVADKPDLVPPPGHVRVAVRYAGVNRADLLQRRGLYPAPPGAPPDIPGLEYAGAIDAVGAGVSETKIGERVYGVTGGGSYAEQVVVHEREAARIPDGVSERDAAAVPEAFITAYDGLVLRGRLLPGERVLVHAVGSGVGTAAVQVAKALGCTVVGTSRTASKLDRAKDLGLDVGVVVESPASVEKNVRAAFPHDIDVVVDLVGGGYVAATLPLLASSGRLVVIGLTAGISSDLDLGLLLRRRLSIVGTVLRARPLEEKIQAADVLRRTLSPWLARGMIKPVVEAVFPLTQATEALAAIASNATFGKVLIEVRA